MKHLHNDGNVIERENTNSKTNEKRKTKIIVIVKLRVLYKN